MCMCKIQSIKNGLKQCHLLCRCYRVFCFISAFLLLFLFGELIVECLLNMRLRPGLRTVQWRRPCPWAAESLLWSPEIFTVVIIRKKGTIINEEKMQWACLAPFVFAKITQFFFCFQIYLKNHKELLSITSLFRCPQWAGIGQVKAQS